MARPRQPGALDRLLVVARAASSRRRAWIRYSSGRREETEREIDVLGISWREDHWLVAARCELRRAFRLFRLERVIAAEVTARPAEVVPPRGFDARFFSSLGFLEPGGAGALATLRLVPPLAEVAAVLFPSALYEETWRGDVLCHLRATDRAALEALASSLDPAASLLDPVASRDAGGWVRRGPP